MHFVAPRQRQLVTRDSAILSSARAIFLELGYHGLTMARVAEKCGIPKGTVYLRFTSKEDILIALAERSLFKRTAMMQRGAVFAGRPRERILVVGEALGLFTRLYPEDSRILHASLGVAPEKASPERTQSWISRQREAVAIVRAIIEDAEREGDLVLSDASCVEEVILGLWALVEGAHSLMLGGLLRASIQIDSPTQRVGRFFNFVADGYGWRPLSSEWDYEETVARARREIFSEEVRQVYGPDAWYGDGR